MANIDTHIHLCSCNKPSHCWAYKQRRNCKFYLSYYFHMFAINQYSFQMPHLPISPWYQTTTSILKPNMNLMQSTLSPGTVFTYNHIIGICPWTDMAATLQTHVSQHCYCNLHIDPTLLHISVIKNLNIYLPCYCHICASNKYSHQVKSTFHIYKLLEGHWMGEYDNIYTKY